MSAYMWRYRYKDTDLFMQFMSDVASLLHDGDSAIGVTDEDDGTTVTDDLVNASDNEETTEVTEGTSTVAKRCGKRKIIPYRSMLMNDSRYNNEQYVILTIKGEPYPATCRHCRKAVDPGTLCFRIQGALAVDYISKNVVERAFYYHGNHCVTSSQPIWTNIRKPTVFDVSDEVSNAQILFIENSCILVRRK